MKTNDSLVAAALALTLAACSGGGHSHQPVHRHHDFDKPETYAKRWNGPERDAWQKPETIMTKLRLGDGMQVADLGAGTGYMTSRLAKAVGEGGKVYALDVSQEMIDYLRDRVPAQVELRKVSRRSTGLADASLDRLMTLNTWHHIEQRGSYAAELTRVLKPGGFVLVVDFVPGAEGPGPPPEMRLSAEQVSKELRQGGLEVEVLEEDLPRHYIVRGVKP